MRRVQDIAAGFAAGVAATAIASRAWPRLTGRGGAGRRIGGTAPAAGAGDAGTTQANLTERDQPGHGREAERPGDIPLRGWKDILLRTWTEFGDDQIPLIAAGCTFYTLLALFPGVTAFVALYGLFADVSDAQRHIAGLSALLPGGAISLIGDQMLKVASARDGQLSLAFVVGLATALWSANGAMKAIISGLNIAYEQKETRGLVGKIVVPLGFTLGFLAFVISAIGLAAVGAVVERRLGAGAGLFYSLVYWPALLLGLGLGMTLLYRFGPSRSRARWRWITWGSAVAAVSWVVMSGAFSYYVAHFGTYDKSYGALGGVIGFMTWTWLSSMVVLLGAELNSEIEHQTAADSTTGAPRPLGERGAVMADTIGPSR